MLILGVLSVWADYIALTPFYILEMILASESHHRKDSVFYYCRNVWATHKTKIWDNVRVVTHTLPQVVEITIAFANKQKKFFKMYLATPHALIPQFNTQSTLYSRNL